MFRTDVSTAAASLPAPAAPGSPGYFTNGSPTVAATVVDADWLNMVQEELMSPVLAAGLTPSKTTRNQVLTALQAMFGQLGEANSWTKTQTFDGNVAVEQTLSVTGAATITGTLNAGGNLTVAGEAVFGNGIGGSTFTAGVYGGFPTYTLANGVSLQYGGGNLALHNGSGQAYLDAAGAWHANGGFSGNLTGNVTGNLTGNVTGNVSGSSGSCTGNAATATSAGYATNAGTAASCSGNAATATSAGYATSAGTAGSCSGNSATATSAGYAASAGNAATATKLANVRTIGFNSGPVTGEVSFDGSNDAVGSTAIGAKALSWSYIADIGANSILGNPNGSIGPTESLSPAQIISMLGFLLNWNGTSPGSLTIPTNNGNLIINWGAMYNAPANADTVAVNFATPFTTGMYPVASGAGGGPASVTSASNLNSITCHNNTGVIQNINWIAIGK